MGSSLAAPLLSLFLAAAPGEPASPAPEGRDAAPFEAPQAQDSQPQPPKPGLLRQIGGDFGRTFASEGSLWIFGAGAAAALAARPLDRSIQRSRFNSDLHDSTTLDALFEPGHRAGDVSVQLGAPLAMLAVGKLAKKRRLTELGGDLFRAQVVSGSLTTVLKLSVDRQRPDGSNRLSFPSGHASGAFASATVVQRRYGWKAGAPAYAVAAWIAASRLNENKHFLSDVTFGAAIGIAAGRAVTVGRGRLRVTATPQAVAGGGAGLQLTLVRRPGPPRQ
jgi:membrane-associated phospholipid phosphatase